MSSEHAEARNTVFHKVAGPPYRFPMSKTTEPIIAPRLRAPQPQLAAEWKNGLETISGFCQRKLRLVLAEQKSDMRTKLKVSRKCRRRNRRDTNVKQPFPTNEINRLVYVRARRQRDWTVGCGRKTPDEGSDRWPSHRPEAWRIRMKNLLQRRDDSPFPRLARDPLPGQRHDPSPARSRTAAFCSLRESASTNQDCRRL